MIKCKIFVLRIGKCSDPSCIFYSVLKQSSLLIKANCKISNLVSYIRFMT